jgi:hydrogenase expression/formation protein HypE
VIEMTDTERILLGHGGGGRLSRNLIENEIVTRFGGKGPLAGLPDGARLQLGGETLVFSTDSFVVSPLEFPGGDIGKLAVHGTVNDVSVSGAVPLWLSLALIIEEGLEMNTLRRILDSIRTASEEIGVQVVTGDTKVVARGQCDGIYINTAGIGRAIPGLNTAVNKILPGDAVIASGTLGDHGMAVMAAREKLTLNNALESDTASVHRLVAAVSQWADRVKFMRDPTRGGAAAVLGEIAENSSFGISLREESIPYNPDARAVAEVLGIDLLHVASEGRMLLVCSPEIADSLLQSWKKLPEGAGAAIIGEVTEEAGRVVLETQIGGRRMVDIPQGELLPRIC